MEYSKCQRCGRALKNPKCRKLGYGETCYKKLDTKTTQKLFDTSGLGSGEEDAGNIKNY